MEPEARYTFVGAALLALVVLASMSFVWLSRSGVASEFRFYTVYFERQSLEGLQIGSDVNMKGIKVGRVESFALDRGNINRVKVKVRVARRTPVSTNTAAVIGRNLLTGIARIDLQTPGAPGPELEEVRDDEDYPVIAEGSSNLDQIAKTANHLVASADATLASVGRFLDDDNRKNFTEALAGIRDLAAGLNKRLDSIDRTTLALSDTARSFQKSSEAIAGVAERTGAQIVPVTREAEVALRDSQVTMKEMQGALRDLASATRRLERDASSLAQRADTAVDIGTQELRATAQQLRSSMETLSRTADRLQDPRAALLGPGERQLGPGERIK